MFKVWAWLRLTRFISEDLPHRFASLPLDGQLELRYFSRYWSKQNERAIYELFFHFAFWVRKLLWSQWLWVLYVANSNHFSS